MAIDEQWVEDVKRWVLASREPVGDPGDDIALGVEAAQPALQVLYWPDAVIDPAETRRWLVATLDAARPASRSDRFIDPW